MYSSIMGLANMDVSPSNDSGSIRPDVNLMSDEFNFSPISEEARESGDGDSGGESKENLSEFDITRNNNHQAVRTDIITDSRDSKKLKDKRTSKIPIRQSKLPFVSKISESHSSQMEQHEFSTYEENLVSAPTTDESGGIDHKNVNMKSPTFVDNFDNMNREQVQVYDSGGGSDPFQEVSERNGLSAIGGFKFSRLNDENANGIQTGLNSGAKGDLLERHLIELSSRDFQDIFRDLSRTHDGGDEPYISSLTSLSPRAPLASDDLDVPLLEAPEEFRCTSEEVGGRDACIVKQVDIGEPEDRHIDSSYRDCDNACKAETGDTTRRTTEEVEGDHGSASAGRDRSVELEKSANRHCANPVDDNQVPSGHNNRVVIEEHVGSTAPVQVNSDTSRPYVDGVNRVPPVAADEMNEPLGCGNERAESCIIKGAEINIVGWSNSGKDECAGEGDAVNVPGSTESSCDVCVRPCADRPQSETTTGPSIEIGVAKCAQASGCSRVSTAKVCVALDSAQLNSICGESKRTNSRTDTEGIDRIAPREADVSKNIGDSGSGKESENIEETCNKIGVVNSSFSKHLSWSFRNGRLVFDVADHHRDGTEAVVAGEINSGTGKANRSESAEVGEKGENDSDEQSDNSQDNDEINKVLYSKDLNKRIDENRSRLKYLEQKLKEAGITDEETLARSKLVDVDQHKCKNSKTVEQVVDKSSTIQDNKKPDYDANQNILKNQNSISLSEGAKEDSENDVEVIPEGTDAVDFTAGDFCEFDVRQVGTFAGFNGYWKVYDELDDDSDCERTEHRLIGKTEITEDVNKMGIDGERAKHNPDRDNLKSLLKRPGKNKDKRSNRVVFNENKNEFFDADYIILIREECDYDEEDDDGVCTCNQHEMVRLTCCEPNCNCTVYDGYEQTPQSPKFAPPLEFVDAVTLSPPEGYKDMELEEQQLLALQQIARRGQRTAVCRECSGGAHDEMEDDGDGSQSDNEGCGETNSDHEEQEEKEKTDQSQQTTPTTPPNDADSPNSQRYILETITMTTVTEQRILREVEEERKSGNVNPVPGGSPINGILKGGKLWKQQSVETNCNKPFEPQQISDSNITSDEEGSNRRSVRFIESEQNKRDICDGAPDNSTDENNTAENSNVQTKPSENANNSISPESTEMMLTFKLGNHVLISNNSLKPNSAVRQLFPCTKQLNGKAEDESIHQYLVTAESLRAFEEAKRSKLPQIIQSGETDESIKRAIERNTLRRSLIRYEPRSKKNVQKTDNSLVERIKQLTCDVDDINQTEEIPFRASPPGEEARNSPEVNHPACKNIDKSFSPSSSSTASSNSSSMSSTYKKITDLFGKRDKIIDAQSNVVNEPKLTPSLPDLGNGSSHMHEIGETSHSVVAKVNSANEPRKQFLSTLAPLTACVSGLGHTDEYYYQMNNHVGERSSLASSVGTEYSLEDIDEGLKNLDEESKKIAPDVLAGTPSASESGDELAMFVQQDASRIERIKKKYQPEQTNKEDEDDEHDDYGFNRRPSVRGIKPRFGSTTEILQQIQNQLQPPTSTARVAWPYYSESGLTGVDNSKSRNINQNMPNYQYPNVPEELKTRNLAPHYRPTSLQDETIYQNCTNQRCVREVYRANGNQTYSSFVKVGGGCTEYYQSLPRTRNGRPQSPPPLELSKNYHQTMVYIPYNHIEGYQQTPYYQSNDYVRVSNQNQINKRYIEPIYQQRVHSQVDEHHYASNMLPPIPLKPVVRIPLSQQPHLMTSRSESPVPGQFSTARSTQTPLASSSTCSFYPGNPRYRPMVGPVWTNDCNYVTKTNRHSFPSAVPRYPPADSISLTDSDSQHSGQLPNGFRQSVELNFTQKDSLPNSPTKPRFLERGVPEGAAANVPSQDITINSQSSSSTMTSPTSPQNPPPHSNQKPLFYAMNV